MCIRHTAAFDAASASSAPGARIASTSLIIAAPAAIAARITRGLRVSIGNGFAATARRSSNGRTRAIFFLVIDRRRAGARRFPADVEDIGAFRQQLPGVRMRRFQADVTAAVGK